MPVQEKTLEKTLHIDIPVKLTEVKDVFSIASLSFEGDLPAALFHLGLVMDDIIKRLLGGLSIFTMVMTIPQVLRIWISHRAGGISMVSWGAYLVSAAVLLWYGLQKHDKNIYLPCIGWILLDSAVIVGALVYG